MGFMDFFKRKSSGDVAKDRLKLLLVSGVARDFAEAFSRADIIVGPTSPAPAPKIGDSALDHLQTYLADIYTIPANLAGLPAMSIPCGTVRESGMELPVGFQMMAPHFREDLLLKTGFALGK